MGESIPDKRHGKCPMCKKENKVLTKHHEYLLDKKKGVIIQLCEKCHDHYNWYFRHLKKKYHYTGRIR